ncbi:caspase family protein [Amycolatopsis sp. lyj-109]|uniref:VMAP-C domain-containing protein n=1 Tax=Amycolatopsis sp. lyj-109 TaxID=2789287 RepID=UPI00397DD472
MSSGAVDEGGRRFLIATGTSQHVLMPEENRLELDAEVDRVTRLFARFGYTIAEGFRPNMTGEQLKLAIRRFFAQCTEQDIVVFYYTGHGEVDGQDFLLLPHDANPADAHERGIPAHELARWLLAGTKTGNLLVILDTCHAGHGAEQMAVDAMRTLGSRPWSSPPSGVCLVTATRPKERAKSCAFTQAFERAVDDVDRPGYGREFLDIADIVGKITGTRLTPQWQHAGFHVIGGEQPGPFLPAQSGDVLRRLVRQEVVALFKDPFIGERDRILRKDERKRLHQLLTALPAPDTATLNSLYCEAVELATGTRPEPEPARFGDYLDLFDQLEEFLLGAPGTQHPVLVCCELLLGRLARFTDTAGLADLTERLSARMGVPRMTSHDATAKGPLSVIVRLLPARQAEHYLLTVWCYYGPDQVDVLHQSAEAVSTGRARDELRTVLAGALDELASHQYGGAVDEILVEFILPTELYGEAVEDWPVGEEAHWADRLGWLHPVVLRDLHRLRHPRLHHRWRSGWQQLSAHSDQHGSLPITWVDGHQRPDLDEFGARFFGGSQSAAVAFTQPPTAAPGRDVLGIGLRAGVGVMIWRRTGCRSGAQSCDCPKFQQTVVDRIGSVPIADLPVAVHTLRLTGGAEADGVVLLWDDPARWPEPPIRFADPARSTR